MDPILEIAQRHSLVVIEDAAQAIGAEYKGRRAGSMGHYGCFSFFPSKNLGGGGDGGMVVTQDAERAEKLRVLRVHGSKPKYYHKLVGGNFRLDALQAAIVNAKLPHLDAWTAARQANAHRYRGAVRGSRAWSRGARRSFPKRPPTPPHLQPVRHRVPRRDEFRKHLTDQGIGTEIYYPVPLHLQECFDYLGHREGEYPLSEAAARETVALPIYPELTRSRSDTSSSRSGSSSVKTGRGARPCRARASG